MPRILKAAMPLILLFAAGCATRPPPVSLQLGPIICPQSQLNEDAAPPALDQAFVAGLSDEAQAYILDREAWWEGVLATAQDYEADALETCADYNRALEAADAAIG